MSRKKKVTVEMVDEALGAIGAASIIHEDDIPEWLDMSGARTIKDSIHEKAIGKEAGRKFRYAQRNEVIDRLLDKRNEVDPPVHTITESGD